jgi:hypothetical protein
MKSDLSTRVGVIRSARRVRGNGSARQVGYEDVRVPTVMECCPDRAHRRREAQLTTDETATGGRPE